MLTGVEGYLLATDLNSSIRELVAGGPAAERLRRAAERPDFLPLQGATTQYLEGEPVLALRLDEDLALWLGPKAGGEPFRDEDVKLAEPLGTLAGMLLTRSRLTSELRELNKRLVTAQEEERARLAMEIHDGPLQKALYLASTQGSKAKVSELARALGQELRAIGVALQPPALEHLGLYYAVEWLVRSVADEQHMEIQLEAAGFPEEGRFPADIELALYRCLQESLTNVAKHARASRVVVTLSMDGGRVMAEVRDNGIGMEPARQREAVENGRLGLVGMRERLGQVGGRVQVQSRKGEGTAVSMEVPLSPAGAE